MAQKKWRDINGVLLLNKPVGLSSNGALQQARRVFQARKAGHAGTLDPLASGLLLCAFGHATKFINDLIESDKSYVATVRLGQSSDTGDGEGQIAQADPANVLASLNEDQIGAALTTLIGTIEQRPPMHSAIKHNGKPLYKYARQGRDVERAARQIHIGSLQLLQTKLPDITVRVTCSKGTYIRVLAEDIGKAVGCGAYLAGLHRETVAGFDVNDAVDLQALQAMSADQLSVELRPIDAMVANLPSCELPSSLAEKFLHGQAVPRSVGKCTAQPGVSHERWRVYQQDGEHTKGNPCFLGIASLDGDQLAPKRLVIARH